RRDTGVTLAHPQRAKHPSTLPASSCTWRCGANCPLMPLRAAESAKIGAEVGNSRQGGAAEGSAEEDGGLVVAGLRHRVELAERVFERDVRDVRAAERDHATPQLVHHGVDRGQTVPGGEHAVVGGRRSAALDVAERRRARLDAEAGFDLGREEVADAAEPWPPESIEAALRVGVIHRVELETFGDDDERGATA